MTRPRIDWGTEAPLSIPQARKVLLYGADDTPLLHVDEANQRIGFGTSEPERELHWKGSDTVTVLLESTGSGKNVAIDFESDGQIWRSMIAAGASDQYRIKDVTGGGDAFEVQPGAPSGSIDVEADGDVSIGAGFLKNDETTTAAAPTTTEFPEDKQFGFHWDSNASTLYLVYNRNGTIHKVALP